MGTTTSQDENVDGKVDEKGNKQKLGLQSNYRDGWEIPHPTSATPRERERERGKIQKGLEDVNLLRRTIALEID